jgi:ribonuclease VapC
LRPIEDAAERRISAVNFVEAAVVIDGSRDPIASRRFDDLLKEARVRIEPVTEIHARLARDAYQDFGKGSGHSAKLNLGDCFAYALAKTTGEPLLFIGADFGHTDIM